MTRRLLALAATLTLAAGCATTPVNHASAPADTSSPAQRFAGCTLGQADAHGWAVLCHHGAMAIVHVGDTRFPAAKRLALGLAALTKLPSVKVSGRRTLSLTLAGAPRQVTVLTYARTAEQPPRPSTSLFAMFDLPGHQGVNLVCGGRKGRAVKRCGPMLRWMAAHPHTPPQVLRAGKDTTWPPARALARLHGCKVKSHTLALLRLTCGAKMVQVVRYDPKLDPAQRRKRLRRAAHLALRKARRSLSPSSTLDEVRCTVSGVAGTCERIQAAGQGQTMTLLLGTGDVFGKPALVVCASPGVGIGGREDCDPYLVQTGGSLVSPGLASSLSPVSPGGPRFGKPEGKPTGAFAGCRIDEMQPQGYSVLCGHMVANVLRATAADIGPVLQRQEAIQALREHPQHRPTVASRRVVLAGKPRTITVLTFPTATRIEQVPSTKAFAFVRLSPAHLVFVDCTAPGQTVRPRCLELLDAMARQPWPLPPGARPLETRYPEAPTGHWERSLALPTRASAASGPAWPPAKGLVGLPGMCEARRVDPGQVVVGCHGTSAVLQRLAGDASPATSRSHLAAEAARLAASHHGSAGTPHPVPCRIGGEATTCQRVRLTHGHQSTDLTLGAGRLLGASALVECIDHFPGRANPPACDQFLDAPPGTPGAEPPVPALSWIPAALRHAPKACAHRMEYDELEVFCGRQVTTVFREPEVAEARRHPRRDTDALWNVVDGQLYALQETGRHLDGVEWHACSFQGDRRPCALVRHEGEHGPVVTLFTNATKGSKPLELSCTWPGAGGQPGGLCARLVTVGGPIAAPPKPHRTKR